LNGGKCRLHEKGEGQTIRRAWVPLPLQFVLWIFTWGRPGFDSGFVMRVSMPGDGDRPAKSIPKP